VCAAVSLRGEPISEHASLPGGGSVEVWVGVPDDPYVAKSERSTVDLQLREGANVLASISTVLDPDQTSEAHQLVREVRASIEADEIPLTASALEPFADRLR
jgi:hypothetical protein